MSLEPDRIVVGWARGTHLDRQYYCPPHVPRSQRTLGERFDAVSLDRARHVDARCKTCGERLARAPRVPQREEPSP